MNKQEAIEKIKDLYSFVMEDGPFEVDLIIKNQVIDIISKIDEPQKIMVPKFVAEWIEWCKANDVTLLGGISPIDELGSTICSEKRVKSRDATRWAKQNQETFARAWFDGYEIEQEKLYTVEIGGVGSNKLFKNTRKNKYIFHSGKGLEGYTDKLTEQEIKKADERLWEFAKPVEDK